MANCESAADLQRIKVVLLQDCALCLVSQNDISAFEKLPPFDNLINVKFSFLK